jgi:DNA polymerase-3 subunit gamma/tau
VEFISFENDTLTWESCADEECKKLLKHGYGVIKQFVREIFGFNTKITHIPCSKTITKPTKQPEGMQSASTVADIEMATQSCIPQCNDEAIEEQKMDIRDEEMVKKAIELFEVKKQIIKPNL